MNAPAREQHWVAGDQFYSRELKTEVIPIAERDCARAVATVFAGFGDGPQIAALIAAAPDLLVALGECLPLIDAVRGARYFPPPMTRDDLEILAGGVRAILCKAEGKR